MNQGSAQHSEQEKSVLQNVQEYYGKVLSTNADLKTTACCLADTIPRHLRSILSEIHDEVHEKFYGCGSPIPSELKGRTVLDLGCGSGRDCFLLAKLVGPEGRVIGVDMTDEQLAVARKHTDYHMTKFGYSRPNVEFRKGYIEDLKSLDIPDGSIDVVVSNCVINLSPAKDRVFAEIFRVLKPGGELYFSDVFSGRRVPEPLTKDPVVLGECLGGALYIGDFRRMLRNVGFYDYRVVNRSVLEVTHPEVKAKVGAIDFHSMTVRAFKLDLEDACEDYGQVAYYLGTIPEAPGVFALDDHHVFTKNKPMLVCSNTASMLKDSRLSPHFRVEGDLSTHYGLFDCAPQTSSASTTGSASTGACC